MSGLIQELKRRNVIKVGAAYIFLSWLLAQVADLAAETFSAPEWVMKMLVTLLVLGLPLALFFAWAFELTPEGIKKERDVDRSQSITSQTGRKLDFVIIGVLLLGLSYFAFDKFIVTESDSDAENTATSTSTVSEATEKSIAVLPFVNMSSDPEQEYFSDGIAEEILNSLAKIKEIQVAGRTSSFTFKGQNQDLRQIAETLGVGHILEGSVRKSGNVVRITAQLIRADNGFHLWSETYDRELIDVFAIQDEIASAILEQLKVHLMTGKSNIVVSARTNSKAYELYLLAKQRIYDRNRLSLESAGKLLDQAIVIDAAYAPAQAQRGITHLLLSERSYGVTPDEESDIKAKAHLDKALELDPDSAEAWAGLGLYHYSRPTEMKQGIEALEKALSINPNLIDAANWLSNAYQESNRPAETVKILEEMHQRDPLYKPGFGNLVTRLVDMGQLDRAIRVIDQTRPFMPADPIVNLADAIVSYMQGKTAEGLVHAESALKQNPSDRVFRLWLNVGLSNSYQYERLAEEGIPGFRVRALTILKRREEASILAYELAAEGSVWALFGFLNQTGQSDDLLTYLEDRWINLESFEADISSGGSRGYPQMIEIALAYRRAGQHESSADALSRVRKAHDSLIDQGVDNSLFHLAEARYYALTNDSEKALEYLSRALEGGMVLTARINDQEPVFIDLEGLPEFEAIQFQMIERVNVERQKLGLEAVQT